jgi:hypothetical protein
MNVKSNQKKSKDVQEYDKNKIHNDVWQKIMETEFFRADLEMLITMNNKNSNEAELIIKNNIMYDEIIKEKYYRNSLIRNYMDLLGIIPNKIIEDIKNDEDCDDFM